MEPISPKLPTNEEDLKRLRVLERRPLKWNYRFRRPVSYEEKMKRVDEWLQANAREWKPIMELSNYKCELSN